MGWKNSRDFRAWRKRRGDRFSKIGRQFEQQELPQLLERMKEEGVIVGFAISRPRSPDDYDGKDCEVRMQKDGAVISRAFGVTISREGVYRARLKHPLVPQFCFPIGTKPETIRRRILGLFQ